MELLQTIFREKKLRLQLNNFTQKLNFHVLRLGEEERTIITKKKKEKKGKKGKKGKKRNKPHRGQKWVSGDERVS